MGVSQGGVALCGWKVDDVLMLRSRPRADVVVGEVAEEIVVADEGQAQVGE